MEYPVAGNPSRVTVENCRLCGLPVGRSRLRLEEDGEQLSFCCSGCLQVYRILAGPGGVSGIDFQATDLYRRCRQAGIIGGGDLPIEPHRPAAQEQGDGLELSLTVEGMWCAACAWLIETILRRTPGILAVRVHFLADLATVTYQPHRIGPPEIANLIGGLGYRVNDEKEQADTVQADFLQRLGIGAILTLNVMMLSFGLYGGFFEQLDSIGILTLSLPLALLSAPVLFYSGAPILQRGFRGLGNGCPGMDSLIAIGACTAFGFSCYQLAVGSIHLYFDTADMLITLVLLGTLIDNRARAKVTGSLRTLTRLAGSKIRVVEAGLERWVAADKVAIGAELLVRAGERVPVDGVVAAGSADVDEGVLTGESRPRRKENHDRVFAGSLLVAGELHLIAERLGRDSSLGRMHDLVRQALAAKNPLELLADRILRWFVPLLLALAAGTAAVLFLSGASPATAILRAVTMLVIACPCALGIATPMAKTAIISRARNRGIIIRNPAAFETAAKIDTLIFDKTGTVTEGSYRLRTIHAPGCDELEVLGRIAAAEAHADHFLAREIRQQAMARGAPLPAAAGHLGYPGLGVAATVDNEELLVGSRALMTQAACPIDPRWQALAARAEERGDSVVFAAWRGRVRALLVFGDALRPDAETLLASLRLQGRELWLVSGDSAATTGAVARRLGIELFAGGNTPADKVRLLADLQGQGKRVAMIGDGANDLAALAQADLGIAVGTDPFELAGETADVTLLADSRAGVAEVFELSRSMVRTIRVNLGLAFVDNALGIPLAMAGLLNPLLAVLAMFGSSLAVIANSLRVAGPALGDAGKETGQMAARHGRKKEHDDLSEQMAPVTYEPQEWQGE
ncbi:MAG: heavy metal translocating P-type ATPase [Desulfobulbaceae bacterium]